MTRKRTTLYAIGIGAIALALIGLAILTSQNASLRAQNRALEAEHIDRYKKLSDSLQRASSEAATSEELDEFAEQNQLDLDLIREDLYQLGAELEAVASSSGKTKTIVRNHYNSTTVEPSTEQVPTCKEDGRPIDLHGYTKTIQTTKVEDSNGMQVAKVSFEAAKQAPWSSKVYGIEYTVNNTIGRKSNGQLVLHTELLASSPEAQPGRTFKVTGFQSRLLQTPQRARFDAWDPAIYLSGQFGLGVYPGLQFSAAISLGLSTMSYGDWRFLGVTIGLDGYQHTFFASFAPFLYNVGEPLPWFSDLYLGLYVGIDSELSVSTGIAIATML